MDEAADDQEKADKFFGCGAHRVIILKGVYHSYGQVVGGGVLLSFMNELCVFFG